eukprot:TRINITY_DN962_c0_g1_i2.p1 TRINITY_DN962_c0_g1~~TRINITY_DN962_c0_g1_i2.p1  ORF type:complete len:955 (-),score=215.97 TRINITY_DN962_c0_g1_i2:99-2963(-)
MENNHLLEDTSWNRLVLGHNGCYILYKRICVGNPEKLTGFLGSFDTGLEWQQKPIRMWSQLFLEPRKTAWYGDDGCNYVYSRIPRKPIPWTNELAEIKQLVEKETGNPFNSCLCNRYDDGNMYMNWHSDDEETLGEKSVIASLSLGASRKFFLRPKKGIGLEEDKKFINLEHGTLMLMFGEVQKYYEHCVPKVRNQEGIRINLTFRNITKFVSLNEAALDRIARDVALAKEYQQLSATRIKGGVCGNSKKGAESVLMSGGYGEDIDLGKVVVYTGCGGRRRNGTPFEHQSMDNHFNRALRTNYEQEIALRLVRSSQLKSGFAPHQGWTYDGIYKVKFYWREKGPDGNLRYKFLLVSESNHLKPQTTCKITDMRLENTQGKRSVLIDSNEHADIDTAMVDVPVPRPIQLAPDSRPILAPIIKEETREIIDATDEENTLFITETTPHTSITPVHTPASETVKSENSNASEVHPTATAESATRPSDALTTPLSTCEGSSSPKKEDSLVNSDIVDLNSSGDLPPLQPVEEPESIVVNNNNPEPVEEDNIFCIPEDDPHHYNEETDSEGNTTLTFKIHVSYPSLKFETRRKLLQKPRVMTKQEPWSLPATPIKTEPVLRSNTVLTHEMEIENSNSNCSIDSNVNNNTEHSTSENDGSLSFIEHANLRRLPLKMRSKMTKAKPEEAQLLVDIGKIDLNSTGEVSESSSDAMDVTIKTESKDSLLSSSLLATDESLPEDGMSKPLPNIPSSCESDMEVDTEPAPEDLIEKLVTITVHIENKTKIGTTKIETQYLRGGPESDFAHSGAAQDHTVSKASNSLAVQTPLKMSVSLPATPLAPRAALGPGRRRKREDEDVDGSYEPNKRVKRSLRSNGAVDDKENIVNLNEAVSNDVNIADMLGTNGMASRKTKAGIKRLSWCDVNSPCMYCMEYITGNLILKQACKFRPKGLKKPKARAQKKLV